MSDLIAFLRARLDEDEAEGRNPEMLWGETAADNGLAERRDRARREVQAKRNILDRHEPYVTGSYSGCSWCEDERAVPWPCPDVLDLAAIYVDHPDYRPEEWKP